MRIEKWLPLFNSITRLQTNRSLPRLIGDFLASGTALGMQVDKGLTYPPDLHPVQVCSSKKVLGCTPFTSLAMRFMGSNTIWMYVELGASFFAQRSQAWMCLLVLLTISVNVGGLGYVVFKSTFRGSWLFSFSLEGDQNVLFWILSDLPAHPLA